MARAALDWSRDDLANASGGDVSAATVKLIETNKINSTAGTLGIIQKTFEDNGIEFTSQDGVRMRDDIITVLERKDEDDNLYIRLLDDIYYELQGTNSSVHISFADNSLSPKEVINKLRYIHDNGIGIKYLIKHGDDNLLFPAENYRYLPKGYYINNPFFVYSSKTAVILQETEGQGTKVLIIKNKILADMHKKQFDYLWKNGVQPTYKN